MSTQRYTYSMTCMKCSVDGHAHGTDNDNGPNFSLDEYTKGFRPTSSRNPFNQEFHHSCGTLAVTTMESD